MKIIDAVGIYFDFGFAAVVCVDFGRLANRSGMLKRQTRRNKKLKLLTSAIAPKSQAPFFVLLPLFSAFESRYSALQLVKSLALLHSLLRSNPRKRD
jgi:hypothetical protein